MMAVSGHYNHYDDPDEYWDEEPLVPKGRTPHSSPVVPGREPAVPAPIPAPAFRNDDRRQRNVTTGSRNSGVPKEAFEPPQKSALVDVRVGADGLPTAIDLKRGWKSAYLPSQYGQTIVEAYRYGLYELTMRYVESGARPKSYLPTLREVAPTLLRTRTYEQFRELYNELYSLKNYTMYGPGLNEYGEPMLVVTATRSKLISIVMDSGWAERTDAVFIAQDVLDCCNRIRSMRPALARDMYLERESDRELRALLARHRQQLLRDEV